MFGPRLPRILASRWMALWSAAAIPLPAWQLVPSAGDDEAEPTAPARAAPRANPWAVDSPAPSAEG